MCRYKPYRRNEVIPNEVVCEQVYTYLLDNYHDNQLETDTYRLGQLEENMAYDGDFKPFFQYIADSIHAFARTRRYPRLACYSSQSLIVCLYMLP